MKLILGMMFWTLAVSSLLIIGLFHLQEFIGKENCVVNHLPPQTIGPMADPLPASDAAVITVNQESRYLVVFDDQSKCFSAIIDAMRLRSKLLGMPDGSLEISAKEDGVLQIILKSTPNMMKIMERQGVFELRATVSGSEETLSEDFLVLNRLIPGFERTGNPSQVLITYPESNEQLLEFFDKHNKEDIVIVSDTEILGRVQKDDASKHLLKANRILLSVINLPNLDTIKLIEAAILTPYPVKVELIKQ